MNGSEAEWAQQLRAVIFDLDDTLYDRKAAQATLAKVIFRRFSKLFAGIDRQRVISAFMQSDEKSTVDFYSGRPSDGMREARFEYFLQSLGLTTDYAEEIAGEYMGAYPSIHAPMRGAVKGVKTIAERFSVGLITNGLPDIQYEKLKVIGLEGVFSVILLSEEVGIRKPDPRIFAMAANLLGVSPDECLFVGDSYSHDVVGAKQAGMRTCWLNPGSLESQGSDVEPDIVVSSIPELRDLMVDQRDPTSDEERSS